MTTRPGRRSRLSDHAVATHHHPKLAHHFENMGDQKEATSLGMWVFISQEIMFDGGMLRAYSD
jgi:heme/copper-type cytochrome/quinol oxidase subunit 3